MKKLYWIVSILALILVFSVIAITTAIDADKDREVKIFKSKSFVEKFDIEDIKEIFGIFDKISDKNYKRVIADYVDETDVELFKKRGCLIKHKLRDSTSFECPSNIISKLNVREARIFHVLDLEADQQIKADKVRLEGITGEGVNIVILDTGIDDTHIELSDSILGCENFVTEETCEDLDGHGTHVAGIITANGIYQIDSNYATGTAPAAGIYMLKVCNKDGLCYEDDMAAAMEYAVDNLTNTKIMSISIGGGNFGSHCDSDPLATKVNWLTDEGFTVIVAAGNEGKGVSSPACASGAIAVGAADKSSIVPFWSNQGTALDIKAPGVDILSTYSCIAAGDCGSYWYARMSGTSMSAPHISGVVALLLQTKPSATTNEIKNALYNTADPTAGCQKCRFVWRGKCYRQSIVACTAEDEGAGIVNAYGAYLAVKPTVCEPTLEICDGIDNDCDGLIDEDLTRQCGVTDIGACTYGTETCSAGEWVGCDAVFPIIEICNNVDDDCDEVTDEDLTVYSGTDVGECQQGTIECIEGNMVETQPEIGPNLEVCDNLDNDCDGTVDQNTQQCGEIDVGVCEYGIQTCSAGVWDECVGEIGPTLEICNGLDDDCNGVLPSNEADADSDGYMICEGDCDDSVAEINPGATEICDEIDNNCNEEIDEGGVCDIVTIKCWSAEYNYLKRSRSQFRKFCKCAEGNYGYEGYSYVRGRKTAYQYINTNDNENWETKSVSTYYPAYRVRCIDENWYYTNKDYYFG